MAQPFLGEIKLMGCSFPVRGFAFCRGQLISIAQNDALFNLLGTTYGGDGQVTFGLPDLRGRVPVGQGTLPGGSTYVIGQASGSETVTLTQSQLPAHGHTVFANSGGGDRTSPAASFLASSPAPIYSNTVDTAMNSQTLTSTGGNQPHENMLPFLALNFIIALEGVFPQRN